MVLWRLERHRLSMWSWRPWLLPLPPLLQPPLPMPHRPLLSNQSHLPLPLPLPLLQLLQLQQLQL
jgi:hypothetical protein